MHKNIFAFTAEGSEFPEYVSINRLDNGEVSITIREKPSSGSGARICRNKGDAGAYDCFPGGPHCNNYCNMAPSKGPMQDAPAAVDWVKPGAVAEIVLPAGVWPEDADA